MLFFLFFFYLANIFPRIYLQDWIFSFALIALPSLLLIKSFHPIFHLILNSSLLIFHLDFSSISLCPVKFFDPCLVWIHLSHVNASLCFWVHLIFFWILFSGIFRYWRFSIPFWGIILSFLFMFLIFLHLFLAVYRKACWFSTLMAFICEICLTVEVSAPSVGVSRCVLMGPWVHGQFSSMRQGGHTSCVW